MGGWKTGMLGKGKWYSVFSIQYCSIAVFSTIWYSVFYSVFVGRCLLPLFLPLTLIFSASVSDLRYR